MKHFIDLFDVQAIDPASMNYDAVPAKTCRGCLFQRQFSPVCRRAAALAVAVGKEDCDSGFIYVSRDDPRQLTIE
jgi:hypothetical protein